jgi:ATP synthase protein I
MASGDRRPPWTDFAEVAQVGLTLVVATVIGLGAGYYLDGWLGTKPWLMLVGLGFGIAAGFVNLFRAVKKLEKDGDDRG